MLHTSSQVSFYMVHRKQVDHMANMHINQLIGISLSLSLPHSTFLYIYNVCIDMSKDLRT
jgi:hypothetical protein